MNGLIYKTMEWCQYEGGRTIRRPKGQGAKDWLVGLSIPNMGDRFVTIDTRTVEHCKTNSVEWQEYLLECNCEQATSLPQLLGLME